jgi:Peptidase family M28
MITAAALTTTFNNICKYPNTRLLQVFTITIGLLFVPPAVAQLQYQLVSRDVVMQRLQDAPMKNSDRVLELEKMFREAGCEPTEQPVKGLHQPNVLCLLPGSTRSLIVVGGHLDHVEEGTGVIDDWSGASMLPSLYQSLATHPREHTFLFIGFAGEEEGLLGSEFYVKHLTSEERKGIAAMVNLECLGIGKTEVWTSHSEPILVRMLMASAKSLDLPLGGINVERVGTTDSESFAHYLIPRITITAITQKFMASAAQQEGQHQRDQPGPLLRFVQAYRALSGVVGSASAHGRLGYRKEN